MQLHERIGAWLTPQGCFFRVWAPHAAMVSVMIQDGPYWEITDTVMEQNLVQNGEYWSATVAGVQAWQLYRFKIAHPGTWASGSLAGAAARSTLKEGRGFAYEPGRDHPLLIPSAGDARPAWKLDDFKKAVSQAKQGKIAVLQFHGVPDTAHDWVNTSKEQFERYLKYLADNRFQVIALRDLAKYVHADKAPSNPFAVIEARKRQLSAASK